MAHELEPWILMQMGDIALLTREQIVHAQYLLPARQKPVAQV
jgi:hypothetical protein